MKKPVHSRFICIAISLSLLLALVACSSDNETDSSDDSSSLSDPDPEPAKIAIAQAKQIAPDKVELTFTEQLDVFQPQDLMLSASKGVWSIDLDPRLNIPVKSAVTRVNDLGQTVAVLTLETALNPDATTSTRPDNGEALPLTGGYYSGFKESDMKLADNLLTWQIEGGGWAKNKEEDFKRAWDGKEPKSDWRKNVGGQKVDLATIDNGATIKEIVFLAKMYKDTKDERYRDSVRGAVDYLLKMQYPSGGWPQVYPLAGGYHDYVTFNDSAMMGVMTLFRFILLNEYPFNTDIILPETVDKIKTAHDKGIDYILKSQIKVDGKLTAWCQQHDPVTYEPQHARTYELPSITAMESVGIVKFLMSVPDPSPEVREAIEGALAWFKEAAVEGKQYVKKDPTGKYFNDAEDTIWYRSYEIGTNKPLFVGRDGVPKHDITQIEKERRDGYTWAGKWPLSIQLAIQNGEAHIGYYMYQVYVQVTGKASKTKSGKTLEEQIIGIQGMGA
ncbi:pectate lyase [Paenibacillus tarimensis]